MKYLELVSAAVTEDKQAICERIQLEPFFNQYRQPVNGLSKVGATCCQVDLAVDGLV
jgi:hypothetical protein